MTRSNTEAVTDIQMGALSQETGIPAATWREAYSLAGSAELFETAVNVWRESFATTGVDPRTIAADLRNALDAP
jgi:hypothetical protein